MGNYMDKGSHTFEGDEENIRSDIPNDHNSSEVDTTTDTQSIVSATSSIEVAQEAGESIDYHIFSYKQNIPFKQRQVFRWAAAKLALTEELIRTNQLRSAQLQQSSYLETDTEYLSDDEMDEVTIDQQLHSLEKYRTELVQLLGRLSLNSRSKAKRKKTKKFKRRKLISKCNNNKVQSSDCDYDSEMSEAPKISLHLTICRDKVVKRQPLKIKNC
ncbi:uncharacterized protein LOC101890716 [Musca domestica]|uniref:Uncharacterized protein LOC101890716 n=1 Tax=Musca domestica TaxID=7370 RepID=A0A1I8N8X2_MUSDO|nr:uncharacterized protein LOC101890716 [Musca domestica]